MMANEQITQACMNNVPPKVTDGKNYFFVIQLYLKKQQPCFSKFQTGYFIADVVLMLISLWIENPMNVLAVTEGSVLKGRRY